MTQPAAAPAPEQSTAERLLDTYMVAQRLRLSEQTVRKYIRDGHLRAVRLPRGVYRVSERAFDEFLRAFETQ